MEDIRDTLTSDLHDKLVRRFAGSAQTHINVAYYSCFVKRRQRSCAVSCGDIPRLEYMTSFEQEWKEIACGRTPSQAEAIEAVWDWLNDTPLEALYSRYGSVDWKKRELVRIRDLLLKGFSDLEGATRIELEHLGFDVYHLWFRSETRSAEIYGRADAPKTDFYWDECVLFSFQASDLTALGAVLKRWLCDNAPPSAMRKEFPWLKIGELADYYESGNPVEGEFVQSWNWIERHYDDEHFRPRALVLQFTAELRRSGYDRKLRAGQSIWTFILSRSRHHGLRPDQPCIQFNFGPGIMNVLSKGQEGEESILGVPIAMSSRVEEALARLVNQPID